MRPHYFYCPKSFPRLISGTRIYHLNCSEHNDHGAYLKYERNGRFKRPVQTPRHSAETYSLHIRPRAPPGQRPKPPPHADDPRSRPCSHSPRWRPGTAEPAAEYMPHRIDAERSALEPARSRDPAAAREGKNPRLSFTHKTPRENPEDKKERNR